MSVDRRVFAVAHSAHASALCADAKRGKAHEEDTSRDGIRRRADRDILARRGRRRHPKKTSRTQDASVFDEIVVTAERRRTESADHAIAATVMTGEDVADQRRHHVDQLQFISPSVDGQQFRPGHRLQHPRHRQGRAQLADHHRRDHLSRRRGDLPGLLHRRALLRPRARGNPARPAGHVRGRERHGRRGVRHLERSGHQRRPRRATSRPTSATTTTFGAQGAINLPAGDKFAARVAFNARQPRQLLRHRRPVHRRRRRQTGSVRLGMLWEPSGIAVD